MSMTFYGFIHFHDFSSQLAGLVIHIISCSANSSHLNE